MAIPLASAMLAAALIIIMNGLMLSVGLHRGRIKLGVGVGDDQQLERKVRRHGNLSENAALFVAALALAEIIGGTGQVVIVLAMAFFTARILHSLAFSSLSGSHRVDGANPFLLMRVAGSSLTALSGFALGGYLIFLIRSSL